MDPLQTFVAGFLSAATRLRTLGPAVALLGLCGAVAIAQPFPPSPEDHHRAVAGWLVVHEPDEDGRIVRLSRVHDDYLIDYYSAFWHGNNGYIRRVATARAGAGCGSFPGWEDEPVEPRFAPILDVAAMARRLRAALVLDLAACGATPAQAEAVLAGFEPAFAQAAAYEEEARRWTLAVGESISNYGRVEDEGANATAPQ